ncbi:MAG: hypothetical protein ABIW57_03555 [Polyangia bacterium]
MARLQQEVREQKQLILQLMQMHDALLKYLQLGGGAPDPGAGAPSASLAPAASASSVNPGQGAATAPPPAAGTRALISGTVRSNGGPLTDLYVYLDGPKIVSSRSATVEIKQQGRQFVPAVSVVQVGTRVLFPNEDKVFHNVFSRTPGDAFDLGTLKSGDRPSPVVLLKPGHVEVFCNIHSRMRADILVVPNGYWARVRPDGTFQLPGVPVGGHRLVLWGPGIKPATQRVDVSPAGANIALSAEGIGRKAHLNKQGGAYESYEE